MSVEEREYFDEMAARRDFIYDETERLHGTLLLPIHQFMEIRLGNSRGECFGYIAEWARCLLQNQAPFGVDPNSTPPFKYVKFQSTAGKKYPDLNHLAVLTKNISTFQHEQSNLEKFTQSLKNTFFPDSNQQIAYKQVQRNKFSVNKARGMAEELVALADANSSVIYNLNVGGYRAGHALGFCKIDGKYHFADSNFGWVRFNNAEDFKNWLPMYFEKMTYNKIFNEYVIKSYDLAPAQPQPKPLSKSAVIITCIVLSPILVPVLAITMLSILTYQFVIRGLVYAAIWLKNKLEPKANNAPYVTEIKKPEKSMDTSDIPHKSKPEKTIAHQIPSTYSKVAGALDISFSDLKSAEERAANNPELQRKPKAPVPLVIESSEESMDEGMKYAFL